MDLGNGIVRDNATGLEWQQAEGGNWTWGSALSYCEGLSLGGYSDWRLPNMNELESIVDNTRVNPAINTAYFPNVYSASYWSSTPYLWDGPPEFCFLFSSGESSTCNKTLSYCVRCVRSGTVVPPPSDTTPPTGTITINSGAVYTNSTAALLTLSCDNGTGSGCAQMQFKNDNSTSWSTPETYAITKAWTLSAGDGTKTVYIKFKDAAGNWSYPFNDTIILDTVPPKTTPSLIGTPGDNGWYKSDVTVILTAADATSGVKEIHYILDGAETIISGSTAGFKISADGTYSLSFWAMDNANNPETAHPATINIDKTPPAITATATPAANATGWNNTGVTVSFTCGDAPSCIATCPAPITVAAEGLGQVISGTAVDKAGNSANVSVTLNIDKTAPVVQVWPSTTILWPPNHKIVPVTINGSATDATSTIASVVITVTDKYGVYNQTITSSFGSIINIEAWREGTDKDGRVYTITVVAADRAGNQSTATTMVTVPHDMRK